MLNKVILIGRLTRDPELRYTANSNIPVVHFTLAVDRKHKPSSGERQTDFIDIVCWRALAENCHKYLRKGLAAAVVGSLQVRRYETQDGQKRKATEVLADEVRFLERPKDGATAGREGGESMQDLERQWDAAGTEDLDDEDNDLPF